MLKKPKGFKAKKQTDEDMIVYWKAETVQAKLAYANANNAISRSIYGSIVNMCERQVQKYLKIRAEKIGRSM